MRYLPFVFLLIAILITAGCISNNNGNNVTIVNNIQTASSQSTSIQSTASSSGVVVESGDTISVIYTGMFENKTVFDTNVNKTPLTFTVGAGQMIPGFDTAVRGMQVNEKKTVTIPYDQAYGAYNPQLIETIPRSKFPTSQTIVLGERYYFQDPANGSMTSFTVIRVTSSGITVDRNSPLAGQDLTFDIQIVDIKKRS